MSKLISAIASMAILSFVGMTTPAFADCGGCTVSDAKSTASSSGCPVADAKSTASCEGCTGTCGAGDPAAKVADQHAHADGDMHDHAHDKMGAEKMVQKTGYEIGDKVEGFTLKDTAGAEHSLADLQGKVVMLVFYNQNCPYVVEAHERIGAFAKEYKEKGVEVIAIDPSYNNPLADVAEHQKSVPYTILVNNDSSVARRFNASRTPEVYLLDKEGKLVYTGKFDSGKELDANGNRETPAKDAVDAVLTGQEVPVKKTKAFGCTIKFNPTA
jgi:peroxiredoxin